MKLSLISLISFSFFGIANASSTEVFELNLDTQAASVPGGVTDATLVCSPANHFVGVAWGLVIQTQALAPEYFVKGAYLTSREVYPNAPTEVIAVNLKEQTLKNAYFDSAEGYKVTLDKVTFNAKVHKNNNLFLNCFKRK
ncbi:hypothetical protein [Silvanigrella aquatica]|uniref:Uncharacterized protein n=1 Tax=Silvanigrella aquatica TaxID=1915309 RepID=A0A1L4CXL5_9BACT|nr:hypothetical protein [Silvanigrella aquatica]APJ02684.1 hypothetical protein AXG55_01555 [Silvanigrella aquatica]